MKPDLRHALVLWAAWIAVSLGSYYLFRAVLPADAGMPENESRRLSLWIVLTVSIGLAVGLTATGWWRKAGFTPPSAWRELHWLGIPFVLALLPLAAGVAPHDAAAYSVFIPGFLLTGFAEETMFRGVLVKVLEQRSAMAVAAIVAVLFGLVHLDNIIIRGQVGIILAQAVGAMAFGFGFVALRLRTRAVVPLIGLHALHDVLLWMGKLPVIPISVLQDVVLFGLGLFLLRGRNEA
jgi:membrane protease YdiL (CAAX protease family)